MRCCPSIRLGHGRERDLQEKGEYADGALWSCVVVMNRRERAGRGVYARKAKRPAAAVARRPNWMVRAPAAESLTSESSPFFPPEPVALEPEEDVVMEPEAMGLAGMVPLF
jgi:hypothetical protein